MIALLRYTAATLLHSQRYLAPVLLFLAVLGMFSSNDSGPLPPLYASFAAALLVCSAWLTIALLNVEDPAHRGVVVVAAGGSGRVLVASVAVAGLGCLALTGAGLVFPLVTAAHPVTATDLVVGAEAQLTCAAVGIAIGLLCSRLVIRRQGYALVTGFGLVLVALLVPGLAPVNTVVHLMGEASRSRDLVGPASGFLALAVAILAVAGAATRFVATRRD